jgi:hypothetical protein
MTFAAEHVLSFWRYGNPRVRQDDSVTTANGTGHGSLRQALPDGNGSTMSSP